MQGAQLAQRMCSRHAPFHGGRMGAIVRSNTFPMVTARRQSRKIAALEASRTQSREIREAQKTALKLRQTGRRGRSEN
jgi:hypothetical protein